MTTLLENQLKKKPWPDKCFIGDKKGYISVLVGAMVRVADKCYEIKIHFVERAMVRGWTWSEGRTNVTR